MVTKKSNPAKRGRKPNPASKSGKIRELLKSGMTPAEIANKVGCTPALVYNVKAKAGGASTRKAGRAAKGRPAKANVDGLGGILQAVQNNERERTRMRAALERILSVVSDALA